MKETNGQEAIYQRSMVISLIGRPNVGKSSLFNRLMRKAHKAITFDRPGVTRDRHYGIVEINELAHVKGAEAILVDTGGFYPSRIEENVPRKRDRVMNKFFNIMTEQAKIAIRESDLILFVVDAREGILPFDQTIADYIRKEKKEFWILVNKFDTEKQEGDEFEFYNLGVSENNMFCVSAEHGLGLLSLKEALHRRILNFEEEQKTQIEKQQSNLQRGVTPREKVVARLALIGAPNAGKSTMLNLLLGAERALVSDIPGTTVDPIEGFFDLFFGKDAHLLEDEVSFAKTDNLLFQQYEEFRANNPDVYDSLSLSYNLEEEGTKGVPLYDEEDYLSKETPLLSMDDEEIATSEMDLSSEDLLIEGEIYHKLFAENALSDEDDCQAETEEEFYCEEDTKEETSELAEEVSLEEKEVGSLWRSLHIVDTAGIRRQKSVEGFIEQESVYRSLRCITESDIVIFMIDAVVGIAHQDRRLLDIALDKGKSVIICLNKIDLLNEKLKDEKAKKEWIADLRATVPWLNYCDLIPLSAKYNKHIGKLKEAIKRTVLTRRKNISTGKLNRYVYHLIEQNPVAIRNSGKRLKVKYASMIKSGPPTFLFFTNLSKDIPDNFKTYLKNGLRKEFKFDNTPIHIIFRTGEDLSRRLEKRMKEVSTRN